MSPRLDIDSKESFIPAIPKYVLTERGSAKKNRYSTFTSPKRQERVKPSPSIPQKDTFSPKLDLKTKLCNMHQIQLNAEKAEKAPGKLKLSTFTFYNFIVSKSPLLERISASIVKACNMPVRHTHFDIKVDACMKGKIKVNIPTSVVQKEKSQGKLHQRQNSENSKYLKVDEIINT